MTIRLAVIADIHGNFRALQAVLQDIKSQQVDSIISLGDNVGYGPEPEEVVRELSSRQIFSVMGNHELALLSPNYYSRLNPTSRDSIDITKTLLSAASLSWLATLPPTAVKHGARFVHGCPPLSITTYLYHPSKTRLKRIFLNYSEFVAFVGHTHSLALYTRLKSGEIMRHHPENETITLNRKNRYLIIPGSVGQPRDNMNNKAKYGIWNQNSSSFKIRSVSYDVAATVQLIRERGFPSHNAQRLVW